MPSEAGIVARRLIFWIAAIADVHALVLQHHDRHFKQIAPVTGQPTAWLTRPGSLA